MPPPQKNKNKKTQLFKVPRDKKNMNLPELILEWILKLIGKAAEVDETSRYNQVTKDGALNVF